MESTHNNNDSVSHSMQSKIDGIDWYHDFDFPCGLKARTEAPDGGWHRMLWAFMERRLDKIDLQGKSVLDIGCWDGYWSFYAENRGAKSVLAADDISQNWAEGTGLSLAKELFNSQIEINQGISVYNIASLKQKFDVIFCLGVHYHLYDPYYAFCQIRHCCHKDTVIVFQGSMSHKLKPNTAQYCFNDTAQQTFLPSISMLEISLAAAYFEVVDIAYFQKPGAFQKLKELVKMALGRPNGINSVSVVCKPFEGENEHQPYVPPFGLAAYDPRYRGKD